MEKKSQEQRFGEGVSGASQLAVSSAKEAIEPFKATVPFQMLLERQMPSLPLDYVSCDLAAEDWDLSSVVIRHLHQLGATDIDTSPWVRVASTNGAGLAGGRVSKLELRELRMRAEVPPTPMCPKSTRVTATLCLISSDSESHTPSLTFMSSKVSHDVPFGEKLLVQEKVELTSTGSGGVDLRISGRVVFLKHCGMFQSRINSTIISELAVAAEALASQLESLSPADGCGDCRQELTLPSDGSIRTEHVWELQRRVALWSDVWHAPFLPHDGVKRWRWVNSEYKPHEQCLAFAKKSSRCETPPVGMPPGWVPVGDWQPERSSQTTSDGWQYSVDFYSADQFWCKSPFALHVRRRRWTCHFKRADAI